MSKPKLNVQALVALAVKAEGGKHSVNIADGSELAARLFELLAAMPAGDVCELLARYRSPRHRRLPRVADLAPRRKPARR
jgi:hypothetical protein